MPAFERDPLSVRYDQAAERFAARAIAAKGGWVSTTLQPPGPKLAEWGLRHGIDVHMIRYTGSPKSAGVVETLYQAAFRRAVYYTPRIYIRSGHRTHALKFRWGKRTALGRVAQARVFPVRPASDWAARNRPHHD